MREHGELIPRLRGVYAVGHAAPTGSPGRRRRCLPVRSLPVCASYSPTGLWRLGGPPRSDQPVDILINGDTTVRLPGIRSHRTKHLDREGRADPSWAAGHEPGAQLLDVASLVSLDELERMLDDALERKLVRISQVREVIARYGAGRPGVHRLHPP